MRFKKQRKSIEIVKSQKPNPSMLRMAGIFLKLGAIIPAMAIPTAAASFVKLGLAFSRSVRFFLAVDLFPFRIKRRKCMKKSLCLILVLVAAGGTGASNQ